MKSVCSLLLGLLLLSPVGLAAAERATAAAPAGKLKYRCEYYRTTNGQVFSVMGCDVKHAREQAYANCMKYLRKGHSCVFMGCNEWGASGRCL